MANIKSLRWMLFIMVLTCFWMFVPLLIITRIAGPMGGIGLLVSLAFVWFGAAKVNAWLVHNSATFRVIWEWARENEETP
jgi:hypothetical protein